MVDRE
jgi:hypothetical protein